MDYEDILLTFIAYLNKRRAALYRRVLLSHNEMRNKIIFERRKALRKTRVLLTVCEIPPSFFATNPPRFRGFRTHLRLDNFMITLKQPGNENLYFESFRMSSKSFTLLCEKLKPFLENSETFMTTPLPIEKQIAICLFRLASCAEYRVIGNVFGVHKSTVHKYFHRVINAILKLRREYLQFPQLEEAKRIAEAFEDVTKIPNIIGAIDGTHIPVLPPSEGYLDYINRKGWASIVLQAVVDNKYLFRDISVKFPGSTHDATVFKESGLFKNSSKLIPSHYTLIDDMQVPFMLIGDPAYPLLPWLMKPFTGNLSAEEESFNSYLSSGRIVVENAFGRLKGRWRCLLKRMDISPTFVPSVVLACTILHNFVETQKETYFESWTEEIMTEMRSAQPQDRISNEVISEAVMNPKDVRNKLKNFLAQNFPLRSSRF